MALAELVPTWLYLFLFVLSLLTSVSLFLPFTFEGPALYYFTLFYYFLLVSNLFWQCTFTARLLNVRHLEYRNKISGFQPGVVALWGGQRTTFWDQFSPFVSVLRQDLCVLLVPPGELACELGDFPASASWFSVVTLGFQVLTTAFGSLCGFQKCTRFGLA